MKLKSIEVQTAHDIAKDRTVIQLMLAFDPPHGVTCCLPVGTDIREVAAAFREFADYLSAQAE
jgi:hypothetical protein